MNYLTQGFYSSSSKHNKVLFQCSKPRSLKNLTLIHYFHFEHTSINYVHHVFWKTRYKYTCKYVLSMFDNIVHVAIT